MDTYIILTNIVLQHIVLNDILSLGYPGKGIAPYAAPSQGFKIVCFLLLLLLFFFHAFLGVKFRGCHYYLSPVGMRSPLRGPHKYISIDLTNIEIPLFHLCLQLVMKVCLNVRG